MGVGFRSIRAEPHGSNREQARQDVFDYIEMFYTRPGDTAITTACLQSSSKNSISTSSKVSSKTGAIQTSMAAGDSGNAMTGCGLKVILGTTSESGGCIAP